MSKENFTYTIDGVEYCTPPFKVMEEGPKVVGVPSSMYGKYFHELVGISTAQAITIKNDWQWWEIRNERNRIIAHTDWTQNNDVPNSTKTKWQNYRQELRDITKQADPFNITWPTEPT